MYRPRGKPHEAKNVALAQQRTALAEAIQISSISKSPSFRSFKSANSRGAATTTKQIGRMVGSSVETELKQQRQHFEAFREAYQERVCGKRVVYDASTVCYKKQQDSTPHDSEPFEPEPLMKEFLSRYGVRKVSDTKGFARASENPPTPIQKPPTLVRNTIRTVKPQYPLQKLEFGADFIQETTKPEFPPQPPKPILKKKSSKDFSSTEAIKERASIDAIKELREIESRLTESVSSEKLLKDSGMKVYTPEDREQLFQQLQATENQISVATNQLQAIQKILQDNRMLTTVQEEGESEDNEKSCQTDESSQTNQRVKWKVKTTLRGSQNKRTRLVDTLNLLNNRLQNMQDKYFNAPKIKYKSYNEVLKANKQQKKNRKGIETIYKNMEYDYDSTADLELQPTVSSELRQVLNKRDIKAKRGKSEPKTNIYTAKGNDVYDDGDDNISGDNISRDRSNNTTTTTTITSSRMAINESMNSGDATLTDTSNLTNGTITSTNTMTNSGSKFNIKNLKSSAELLSEITTTDVLYAPRKSSNGDGLKYNNIIFNEDFDEEEDDDDHDDDDDIGTTVNNSGVEKAIEKSIKASNYLMKEFDTLRGDYGIKLDDMLVTKAKNVRFSEPREVVERVEQVCSPAADRIKNMFSKFDNILKDSLYSTAATTGK